MSQIWTLMLLRFATNSSFVLKLLLSWFFEKIFFKSEQVWSQHSNLLRFQELFPGNLLSDKRKIFSKKYWSNSVQFWTLVSRQFRFFFGFFSSSSECLMNILIESRMQSCRDIDNRPGARFDYWLERLAECFGTGIRGLTFKFCHQLRRSRKKYAF